MANESLFLEVDSANPNCPKIYSNIFTEITFYPESSNLSFKCVGPAYILYTF